MGYHCHLWANCITIIWASTDCHGSFTVLHILSTFSLTESCTHFLVVIFFPLMNLVEVDVLLTAPPLGPLKLLRDEKDVKDWGPAWVIVSKSSNPDMPKPSEPNGFKNEELIVFCGWEFRPCPWVLVNSATQDQHETMSIWVSRHKQWPWDAQ
jgi:hypothetical protein